MDYRDSAEEAVFRKELRSWLAHRAGEARVNERGAEFAYDLYDRTWHTDLYEGGWMGLSWPVAYGGRGLSSIYEAILNDEVGAFSAPDVPHVGFLGRAILDFGTEEQKASFLPGLLNGSQTWCQGFSEPGAGSDLAALSTRAERTTGGYVITGQKVWTSRAQFADYCLILARTDPAAPKHRGISCFVLEMKQPGVVVKPIRQITGSQAFCEVFLDEANCPEENRIGGEGEGWRLAMQTVAYERGPADVGFISRYRRLLGQLEAGVHEPNAAKAVELGRLYVSVETLRLRVLESLSRRVNGNRPDATSSIDKLLMTETEQLIGKALFDFAGAVPILDANVQELYRYLYSRASSIYGGSSQIQKNIVAERVLYLESGPRA